MLPPVQMYAPPPPPVGAALAAEAVSTVGTVSPIRATVAPSAMRAIIVFIDAPLLGKIDVSLCLAGAGIANFSLHSPPRRGQQGIDIGANFTPRGSTGPE